MIHFNARWGWLALIDCNLLLTASYHFPFPGKKKRKKRKDNADVEKNDELLMKILLVPCHGHQRGIVPQASLLKSQSVNQNLFFDDLIIITVIIIIIIIIVCYAITCENLSGGVDKGHRGNPDLILFCFQQCVGVSQGSEVVELKIM